jgi:hypothetical protein
VSREQIDDSWLVNESIPFINNADVGRMVNGEKRPEAIWADVARDNQEIAGWDLQQSFERLD